jgi:Domain of unknown function (DUF4145)
MRVERSLRDGDYWGALGSPLYPPGGPDGLMRCPTCGDNTKDAWKMLQTTILRTDDRPVGEAGLADMFETAVPISDREIEGVVLEWMRCENDPCFQTVVRLHETTVGWHNNIPIQNTKTRIVYPPSSGSRPPLSPLVPESLRTDYNEASAILNDSPRMSAVLSRRILADLLEAYCKHDDFGLAARIDHFRADGNRPLDLRENMHHFREIGDFGAHTLKNDQDVIIPVSHRDAEWMLGFLDRCFEYLVIAPEKDRLMRETWDKNIEDAGRRPVDPLEES